MRYKLPTDRLINQLIPHYLSGRKIILFLQSAVYPLKTLNDRFVPFAKEKILEANMTSQVIYFEWYLNYKFSRYFDNPDERIFITDGETIGVDMYHEGADNSKPFTVWHESEKVITANPLEEPRLLYHKQEEKAINRVSFMVCVPAVKIAEHEFAYMLSHVVNTYKLAGKTYLIKINSTEITPNNKR